jgi:quercetin dioxygenase-like cupin family protein
MPPTVTPTRNGVFDLRTPLLKQGITTDIRAKTDHLSIMMKVYADGGENLFHAHNAEDHAFVVLSGQATFHIETEANVKVVNKYEGIMILKDQEYRFESSGPNLVMLRIAGYIPGIEPQGKDTSFIPPKIEMPDRFFPDDCP